LPQSGAGDAAGGTAVKRIATEMKATRGRIRSLWVEYNIEFRRLSPPDQGSETVRYEFAFRDNAAYCYFRNVSRPPTADPRAHSEQPRVYEDGSVLLKWYPERRLALETPVAAVLQQRGIDHFKRTEHYLDAQGYWPYPSPPEVHAAGADRQASQAFFLPQALDEAAYRLLPEPEVIDGATCQVLELSGPDPGSVLDRVWVDPQLGYAPRKRLWAPLGETGPGTTRVHHLRDYRTVQSPVALPWEVESTALVPDRSQKEKLVPVMTALLTVERLEVNTVPASAFRPVYAPGTIIEDGTTGAVRIVPGGEDLLELLVDQARQDFPALGRAGIEEDTASPAAHLVLAGALGCAAGVISFAATRLLRRRRACGVPR
jgi:hypothetical protein